jgi:hypothetical protein
VDIPTKQLGAPNLCRYPGTVTGQRQSDFTGCTRAECTRSEEKYHGGYIRTETKYWETSYDGSRTTGNSAGENGTESTGGGEYSTYISRDDAVL